MGYNDGAGPADQQTCTEWQVALSSGWSIMCRDSNSTFQEPESKKRDFRGEEELAENPELETSTPYGVKDEHLKEWIEFLRHCGGFEVC